MTLVASLVELVVVVSVAIAVSSSVIVGFDRLRATARNVRGRVKRAAAPIGALAAVLLVNSLVREPVAEAAWILGVNITPTIYGIEGEFVAWVQSFAHPALTALFSYAYVFGYAYLLVFPLVAYAALEDGTPLRRLAIAYSVNYTLGLVCYVLFVAYGPRNMIGDSVESLLYTTYPQYQFLTSQVNTNSNVFPSLHTSLSATVAGIAWETRETYPGWSAVATTIAAIIVVSTMYLGIHWATDVAAGLALAATAIWVARRFAE
jgi:membrane-associated phospholipid phosphatase